MIDLSSLASGFHAVTKSFGETLAEAGAVCFDDQGHKPGAYLLVQGNQLAGFCLKYALQWPDVTVRMRLCHNDHEVATEWGAMGIAILLVGKLTGYTSFERSRKGTGFDYWVGEGSDHLFQKKARLEISGIRSGNSSTVKSRVSQKVQQTKQSDKVGKPAYIVVVEFSNPLADMVLK
jgi:hypothetical protein